MMKRLIKNQIFNWGISFFICLSCYLPECYGHPWSFLEKDIDEAYRILFEKVYSYENMKKEMHAFVEAFDAGKYTKITNV